MTVQALVPEQSPVNVVPEEFNVTTVPSGNEYVHVLEAGPDPPAVQLIPEGELAIPNSAVFCPVHLLR